MFSHKNVEDVIQCIILEVLKFAPSLRNEIKIMMFLFLQKC